MDYLSRAVFFVVAIPAIVFHEVAHGYVANLLGDPTARNAGRLSLNPVRHVDLFGTIILPALLAFAGAPVFGYAKPVPINPRFFRDSRRGMLLTGLAGPGTNLALAVVAGVVVRVLGVVPGATDGPLAFVWLFLYLFAEINLVLMFFNLIPIPPFDGSRVIPVFLSREGLRMYAQVERYGMLIIFAIIFLGRGLIGAYFAYTVDPVLRLLTGVS